MTAACRSAALWLGAALTVASSARAQAAVQLALGARAGSVLVRDSIVSRIDVGQRLGPVAALTVSWPLDASWAGALTVDVAWGELRSDEVGGPRVDLGIVRTVAATAGLQRRFPKGLHAGIGIGLLDYAAAHRGIFRSGGPGITALGTALLRYEPFAGMFQRWGVELRYDFHRFLTPVLRDVGFTAPRSVHRVALLVSARVAGTAP